MLTDYNPLNKVGIHESTLIKRINEWGKGKNLKKKTLLRVDYQLMNLVGIMALEKSPFGNHHSYN